MHFKSSIQRRNSTRGEWKETRASMQDKTNNNYLWILTYRENICTYISKFSEGGNNQKL